MFTPEELEGRSFVMVRRGYDPEEVAAFLRAVADDVRRLRADLAEAGKKANPLDTAVADSVAIVQAARESAARIEAQAEERATERLRRAEDEIEQRLTRLRAEADARLTDARERAAGIISEAAAQRTAADAEAAAAKSAALREAAELQVLIRRRRRMLEDAHDSLEQWMSALRDIVVEARDAQEPREADAVDTTVVDALVLEVPAQERPSVVDAYPAEQVGPDGHEPHEHAHEQPASGDPYEAA